MSLFFLYLWQIETFFSPPRGELERPVSALGVYKSSRECVLSVTQTYPKLNEIHKKLFEIDHKTSCVQKVPAAPSIFYRESHSKFWMHLSQTMTDLPEPNHMSRFSKAGDIELVLPHTEKFAAPHQPPKWKIFFGFENEKFYRTSVNHQEQPNLEAQLLKVNSRREPSLCSWRAAGRHNAVLGRGHGMTDLL